MTVSCDKNVIGKINYGYPQHPHHYIVWPDDTQKVRELVSSTIYVAS
jgi:hypothetical protein